MGTRNFRCLLVLAAAAALSACATNAPVSSVAVAAPSAGTPAAAADAKKSERADASYKRMTKNGKEVFCKREGNTGSRTQVFETCLTQEELTALTQKGQDDLRRMQSWPAERSTPQQGYTIGAGTQR